MTMTNAEAHLRDDGSSIGAEPMPPEQLLEQARLHLAEQARERPYVVLFAAATVGYVLGGGVPGWALRMASKAGTRLVAGTLAAAIFGESAARQLR